MSNRGSNNSDGCFGFGCISFLVLGILIVLLCITDNLSENPEAKRLVNNIVIVCLVFCSIGGVLFALLGKPLNRIKDSNAELIKIDRMNGLDFERYVARLLKLNEFSGIEITKASGDYGVDIIAWKNNIKIVFQCKRYKNNIGIKSIQEVYTGKIHYNADVAVVVTNSYFSQSAIQLAEETDVLLWDRSTLTELIRNCTKETSDKDKSLSGNRDNDTKT